VAFKWTGIPVTKYWVIEKNYYISNKNYTIELSVKKKPSEAVSDATRKNAGLQDMRKPVEHFLSLGQQE
jgi:ATP-dependent Clp protease ATP-binding subunit ClpA